MHIFVVERADMETASILSLTLRQQEGGPLFTFVPGQYAGISFMRGMRPSAVRCFSIMSSPTQQDVLQFGIRVSGKFTRRLAALKAGDTVQVHGPYGHFVLDSPRQPSIVMFAGGIGITPFMSMARFVTATDSASSVQLVISVRNQEEAPFVDELRELCRHNPRLRVSYMVSDGPADALHGFQTHKGRVDSSVIDGLFSDQVEDKTAFICGPPAFMRAVTGMLREHGLPNNRIITEAFTQGSGRQSSKIRGWQFNIYALGAVGTAAASIIIMSNDLLKTLPNSLLPNTLTTAPKQAPAHSRQSDLDALVNQLAPLARASQESPALVAANKEVTDAQAKAAEVAAQNAANTGAPAVATPKKTQTPTASAPAPTPAPAPKPTPTPVCTTSASGITTCQ